MFGVAWIIPTLWWLSVHQDRKAEAAWDRLISLGGVGVWENDFVVISLAESQITDDDLALFRDFPFVQTLDLSRTKIRGVGLAYLANATSLEELIVVGTTLDAESLKTFRRQHPNVKVVTTPAPKGTINPFTRKPL